MISFEEDQRRVRRQLDAEIKAKDAEIDRLKDQNEIDYKITVDVCNRNTDLKKLIGELADTLSHYALLNNGEKELISRAREVTK